MIPSLFYVGFKKKSLLLWLAAALVLGALGVYAYTVTPLETLRYLRGEMPELFVVLGYQGDSNLPYFVLSVLYGLLLPLLSLVYGLRAARRVVAAPMEDGRLALLLASRHRRSAILLTLFLAVLAGSVLLLVFAFLGQLILVPVFFPGADLAALTRLALGFLPVALINPAFALMMAAVGSLPRAGRLARFILWLMLLLWMASRLQALRVLRFFTFWSLFEGRSLAAGTGGLLPALLALSLCLVFTLISLVSFSKREL